MVSGSFCGFSRILASAIAFGALGLTNGWAYAGALRMAGATTLTSMVTDTGERYGVDLGTPDFGYCNIGGVRMAGCNASMPVERQILAAQAT